MGCEPGVEEFGDSPGEGQAASPKEPGQRGILSAFTFFLQLFAFFFLFGSSVGVGAAECDLHFGRGDAGFMIVYNKLVCVGGVARRAVWVDDIIFSMAETEFVKWNML